jgi:uncharacterized protein
MPLFNILCYKPDTLEETTVLYNSTDSTLTWKDGTPIISSSKSTTTEKYSIKVGKKNLKKIKIQLGLSCNFECDYCSQRFVPNSEETTPKDVIPFVTNMSSWYDGGEDGLGKETHFEFWGGEPFVYWKTFKPLADELHKKYPNSTFSVITNGSLLDIEKNDWLEKHNFNVSISHDGPGQPVRGPDPLDDPSSKEGIIDLYKRFATKGRFSFNSMINSKNTSRTDIQLFFENFVRDHIGEEYLQYLSIGEGGFVDAYDEGGMANSLLDEEEDIKYRNISLNELRSGLTKRFINQNEKVYGFINSIKKGILLESLPQKCGMDQQENIAVDLLGNVLTCQNVSQVSTNPSGISHLIGNVSDLNSVNIKTATHHSDRKECPTCPVVHICKGACMFLTGDLWEASCNNAFSDSISTFSIAIEEITGYIPMNIDGPQREDRKDIFWWVNGKPEKTRKAKKVIPIQAI